MHVIAAIPSPKAGVFDREQRLPSSFMFLAFNFSNVNNLCAAIDEEKKST
jgi:hypothetical protein